MKKIMDIAAFILDAAKEAGADSAQCTVLEAETREFNVDGGDFSLMRTLFDRYISLTVLKDRRPGSVTVNRFDEDSLRRAAAECVAAAKSAAPDEAREFAPGPVDRDFILGAPEADIDALFTRTAELMDDVKARHPKLLMEQLIAAHTRTKKVYRNTNGVTYRTLAGEYGVSMTYSAHDGEDSTSMYGGSFTSDDLDRPFIESPLIDREMAEVEAQLGAEPIAGKFTGTALFAPGCLAGDVFGQVIANFASDTPLIDGTSLWKDKRGEKVADERITLSVRPLDEHVVCGQRYTAEGYPA